MVNKQRNGKKPIDLKTWEEINNRPPNIKNGGYLAIGHKASPDSEEITDLFYTNRAPKLKIKDQELDVEYSSTEQDDQTLLHFLAGKV